MAHCTCFVVHFTSLLAYGDIACGNNKEELGGENELSFKPQKEENSNNPKKRNTMEPNYTERDFEMYELIEFWKRLDEEKCVVLTDSPWILFKFLDAEK